VVRLRARRVFPASTWISQRVTWNWHSTWSCYAWCETRAHSARSWAGGGFALPRLLQRHSALTASLILGLIWGIWHLPAFFLSGLPQNQLSLPAFLVGTVALSVLMTWVYQHTHGSILFAILIHWIFNTDFLPRGTLPILP